MNGAMDVVAMKAFAGIAFTRIALVCCVLLSFALSCYAAEHIIVYKLGERDAPHWDSLKRYLQKKGYRVSMYDGATTIERQIENVNRINREKAIAFLALDLRPGTRNRAVVVVDDAKAERSRFLTIREVPALHAVESRQLATAIAIPFKASMKELPLFPLLGVDLPGLVLCIEYVQENFPAVLDALDDGLQKYFGRSAGDES
jgi:hypothetical protein